MAAALSASSTFDHTDRPQPHNPSRQPGRLAGGDDLVDVFVGERGFLGQPAQRLGPHDDAGGLQFVAQGVTANAPAARRDGSSSAPPRGTPSGRRQTLPRRPARRTPSPSNPVPARAGRTRRRGSGTSGWPGGKARVAPLRWTHNNRVWPSTWWRSSLAKLCETSKSNRSSPAPATEAKIRRVAAVSTCRFARP